jgi:molybdenum cofactor guanylyltransferase
MIKDFYSGYILAGGKSSRIGENKAFLEIDGKTFLARATETLAEICPSPIKIVLKTWQNEMIDRFPENAEAIYDATDSGSPLDGLHKAFMDAFTRKSKYAVVLAVDLPFVTSEVMTKICDAIEISNKFLAVVPRQVDGRPQPLCGVYNAKYCFYALQRYLSETPNGSIKEFLDTISTRYINEIKLSSDPKLFFNVNHPTDYESLS